MVSLSDNAKKHVTNIKEKELVTNYLKISINSKIPVVKYHIEFLDIDTGEMEKSQERREKKFTMFRVKDWIAENLYEKDQKDIVIGANEILTFRSIKTLDELVEKKEVLELNEKRINQKKKKNVRERPPKRVSFSKTEISFDKTDHQDVENTLNLISQLYLVRIFDREYIKLRDGRFMEKKHVFTTKGREHREFEDFFIEKSVHKCFDVTFMKGEVDWFVIIKPSFKIEEHNPNALDLIDLAMKRKISFKDLKEYFSSFKITRLSYRHTKGQRLQVMGIENFNKANSATKAKFFNRELNKEVELSYFDYVVKTYDRTLKRNSIDFKKMNPKQLLLRVRPMTDERECDYYVPSFCTVDCGLDREQKIGIHQREITDYTKEKNPELLERITNILKKLKDGKYEENMKRFGITIDLKNNLERVPLKRSQNVVITDGKRANHSTSNSFRWGRELKFIQLEKTVDAGNKRIDFIDIVCLSSRNRRSRELCERSMSTILGECRKKVIRHDKKNRVMFGDIIRWRDELTKFENNHKRPPKIVFAVLDHTVRDSSAIYGNVYAYCFAKGIACQFARAKTLEKRFIPSSLFFQLYCKLGGHPWSIRNRKDLFPKHTIVMGVDCSRATNRFYVSTEKELGKNNRFKRNKRKVYPSCFAANCVNLESSWSRRRAYLLKDKNQEISKEAFEDSLSFFMNEYKETFKTFPKFVVIFRDGVGMSQLKKSKDTELNVVKSIMKKKNCKFIFCVVQKRIPTLFFGTNGSNVPAGTIVDSKITFSQEQYKSFFLQISEKKISDFFMTSTESERFPTRPCHYIILHTDFENMDTFQQFTFMECCLYYNYAGTIKVPFVTQLSHCLSQKIYKTVFNKVGDRRNGFEIHLKTNFYNLANDKFGKGKEYVNEKMNVRIDMNEICEKAFVEL